MKLLDVNVGNTDIAAMPATIPFPATHPVVRASLWAVVDCGRQTWWFEERPRKVREIRLSFELIDERARNGDRLTIEARYALSYWPTARLKRDLESWLGRPLTLIERGMPVGQGGFDLALMLGRSCRLELMQRGLYRAITGIRAPIEPDYPPHRAPLFLSLDPNRFDVAAFHRLSDRLKDRVLASPTYQALCEGGADLEALWPAEHVREPTGSELLDGDHIPW